MAGWAGIAQAHGEEAALIALGIALVVLIVPFAVFLFLWRGSLKSKAILCVAYLVSVPAAFYLAFQARSDVLFFVMLFGPPLCVWLVGVWVLRRIRNAQAP